MKKTLFLIAAMTLAFTFCHAQTEKGSQTLGLNLSLSYNKSSQLSIYPAGNTPFGVDTKTTSFSIGPNYSYFVADKLDLGGSLFYSLTDSKNTTTSQGYPVQQTQHTYGGTIFLRKYFMYKDKIGIRTGPFAGYTGGSIKSTYTGTATPYDQDGKITNYNAGALLELVYYPSKNLGFAATLASLYYSHSKTDNGANGYYKNEAVNFNFINSGLTASVFYAFGSK